MTGTSPTEDIEVYKIQTVRHDDDLIVLDSGADVSLLPYEMGNRGIPSLGRRAILEDAQGNRV